MTLASSHNPELVPNKPLVGDAQDFAPGVSLNKQSRSAVQGLSMTVQWSDISIAS
jgi:hypothetical protein